MAFFRGLVALLLVGCAPQRSAGPAAPTPIAEASSGAISVDLLSSSPLVVGQNRVFYRVTNGGEAVPRAQLEQRPSLKRATTEESCPVVNPGDAPNADGLWGGFLIFTQPSSVLEQWTLQLNVDAVQVDFGELRVGDSAIKSVVIREGKELVLSVGYSAPPHVGTNEVVITAHQATDSTKKQFVTVDDLVLSLTTEMPSMGHGASGSVNPTRGEDGLYRGTVVFSMSGDWVLHLSVTANDARLAVFDIPVAL